MRKSVIALIIVGSILTVTGGTLFTIGAVNEKLNRKSVTHSYDISEGITNFQINLSTTNLEFKVAEDGKAKVVCNEREKEFHEVSMSGNTLHISYKSLLEWYESWFDFYSSKMNVTVYLPSGDYHDVNVTTSTGNIIINKEYSFNSINLKASTGDVSLYSSVSNSIKVETSTGQISLNELNADNLELKASTGRIALDKVNVTNDIILSTSTGRKSLNECSAANLTSTSSTGRTNITNSTFNKALNIKASTGDVTIVDSDAETVNIETSTGDVSASFLTSKIVYATTNTGKVDVPPLTSGGLCNIKTSTGDIYVRIKE